MDRGTESDERFRETALLIKGFEILRGVSAIPSSFFVLLKNYATVIINHINMQSLTLLPVLLFTLLLPLTSPQTCSSSQYFNGQRCAPCQSNCLCTSDNGCTSCMPGFTFDPTFTQCKQCPSTSSGYLTPCSDCCSQVTGTQFLCSSCNNQTGFAFIRGGQCVVMEGCGELGLDGVCVGCAVGYWRQSGRCVQCHASCDSCVDSNYCVTCKTGYYNESTGDYPLCLACTGGCSQCTSATACQACAPQYRLSGSTCVACSANCVSCSSTACTQCLTGYTVISSTCYACTDISKSGSLGCLTCVTTGSSITCKSCQSGFFLNSAGACVSCSLTYPNSLTCTSSGPTQCNNDYITPISSRYHLVGTSCILNTRNCKMMNSNGTCSSCYFENGMYYTLSAGTCVNCSITGCDNTRLDVSKGCVCQACLAGYRFVNNICIPCANLRCTSCPMDINNCTSCVDTFGIFSSACAKCNLNNCLNCDGDVSKCLSCANGYYLENSQCYACQTSCSRCTSNTKCVECAAGSYLAETGLCMQLPVNCVEVYETGHCKLCGFGYFPVDGSCYECSINGYNVRCFIDLDGFVSGVLSQLLCVVGGQVHEGDCCFGCGCYGDAHVIGWILNYTV